MQFERHTLETCANFTGTAVVIDVLRAFTTAAFAFDAGVQKIILTDTVENAFRLREQFPNSLLVGEVDGYPIKGFDYPNSPAAFVGLNLSDRTLIQRTTAGTQGVVRSSSAREIFVASLSCAAATATALKKSAAENISFVITDGDEDTACADLIEAHLRGQKPDHLSIENRVRESSHGRRFTEPKHIAFPAEDLKACLEIDRFDFAMKVHREDGLCVLKPFKL